MLEDLAPFIMGICICVVMPVLIVWLVTKAKTQRTEKKMEVLVKAIENGTEIDPDILVDINGGKNVKTKLVEKLGAGVMTTLMGLTFIVLAALHVMSFSAWGYYAGVPLLAVGVGNIVSFLFGIRFLDPEIKADEKKLEK